MVRAESEAEGRAISYRRYLALRQKLTAMGLDVNSLDPDPYDRKAGPGFATERSWTQISEGHEDRAGECE